jgi:signal transduction histidine kinase
MIESLPFKTQARTVDHLGREQIADCPTAISELWKNAYDAYARSVSLHIFDGEEPVAAIFDDGHGMSYEEFVSRWLVVGTESKYDRNETTEEDRNGLPTRTKQGQKGIGRLSSANLGPLLLLISKRKECDFVAALLDWRLFENPYLVLSDIEVPVTKFRERSELEGLLPELFDRLTDNIWGSSDSPERSERLKQAWTTYDAFVQERDQTQQKPSEQIANTIVGATFKLEHLAPWRVWCDDGPTSGTALLVSDIHYDLRAQLPSIPADGGVKGVRKTFLATLSAFTDPFVDPVANEVNAVDPDFTYEVKIWASGVGQSIVEEDRGTLSRQVCDELEHVLSGSIDENGKFTGQVKAFGEWREYKLGYIVPAPTDYTPPSGPTTFVGPFSLYIATYERERMSSTHTDDDHAKFDALAERYGGFLIFRNGLRVLPYGRLNSDFFEIEERRSRSAGREFWNSRRMFGRIALSREANPNLRDKAGREGFIDNRAAKSLKTIVINILKTAARDHFGSASELRKHELPDIQKANLKARAEEARKILAKRNRLKFRSRLKRNLPLAAKLLDRLDTQSSELSIDSIADIEIAQSMIDDLGNELRDLRIVGAPSSLGSSEDDFREFRQLYAKAQSVLEDMSNERRQAIERLNPPRPEEIAEKQMQSLAGQLQSRIRQWSKEITGIQDFEAKRISDLLSARHKAFHQTAHPLIEQVKSGRLGLDDALEEMAAIRMRLEYENEDIFQSYINTLELLRENINIELIATEGTADNIELRDQLNRLNQVAQLGITVEILGHELATNEQLIRTGIKRISNDGEQPGLEQIEAGFEALSHQLDFLSPLKLSGPRTRRAISGKDITEYLREFFRTVTETRNIQIEASDRFKAFAVDEQPSRLFPVFINLVNNSAYWLVNSHTVEPKVLLDVVDEQIVVSDNGPGIDELDQDQLFKMFFTRKVSGGRGIGLYLCRMNLLAGGHSIKYATDKKFRLLPGANFVIDFKGGSFD